MTNIEWIPRNLHYLEGISNKHAYGIIRMINIKNGVREYVKEFDKIKHIPDNSLILTCYAPLRKQLIFSAYETAEDIIGLEGMKNLAEYHDNGYDIRSKSNINFLSYIQDVLERDLRGEIPEEDGSYKGRMYNCATVDKDSPEVIDTLKQNGHGVAMINKKNDND